MSRKIVKFGGINKKNFDMEIEKSKEIRVEYIRVNGFRGLDVDMSIGSKDVWVEGGNGVGKSTVLAGYRWCMSGYVDGVHGKHWGVYPRWVEGRCRVEVRVGIRVNGGEVVEVCRWGDRGDDGKSKYGVSIDGGDYSVWLWRELGLSEDMLRWCVGGDMLIGRSYVEGVEARRVLGVLSDVGEGKIEGITRYEGSGMTVSQVEAIERAVKRESEEMLRWRSYVESVEAIESEAKMSGIGSVKITSGVVCPRCGTVIGGESESVEGGKIDVRALGARIAEAEGIIARCREIRAEAEKEVEAWVSGVTLGCVSYVGGGGERGVGMFFHRMGVPYGMVNSSGRGEMEVAMLAGVCKGVGVLFPLVIDECERWESGKMPKYTGQRIMARVGEGTLKCVKVLG